MGATHTAAAPVAAEPAAREATPRARAMTLVAFSGDMDKLMAGLSIATTAAATGAEVNVFVTFWGLSAVRARKTMKGKSALERMLNLLLPGRGTRTGLSRKNMLGVGPRFFRTIMKQKNVADIDELVAAAQAVGVRFTACAMSMDVMGIERGELIDGVEVAGATACVQNLMSSEATLFV